MIHTTDKASSSITTFLSARPAGPSIAIWSGDGGDTDDVSSTNDHLSAKRRRRSVCSELYAGLPWMVLALSAVQCIAFLTFNSDVVDRLMFSAEPLHRTAEWWRCLSYSIVHMSFVHLGINVAVLLLVGICLEAEQGHVRVLLVYAAGVVGGAMAGAQCQPQLRLPLAGSSAGVSGVLMSHVPHTVLNFNQLPYRYFRPVAILVLCANDAVDLVCLWTGFAQPDANLSPATVMSVAAHIGGAVAGFLAGAVLFTSHVTDAGAMIAVGVARFVCFGLAVLLVINAVP